MSVPDGLSAHGPAVAADEVALVVAEMLSGRPASGELVNRYFTLCIPFYREFLGDHWHTGFYSGGGQFGPAGQLRMERVVAQSAGLHPGCEVLEIGCGVGGPACHLARLTGARIRGLTPNDAQLALAKELAARKALESQMSFDLGSADHLPYGNGSFDAVVFFESVCHFPDRNRFFAEAWRVLKPGGKLAGEDWLATEGMAEDLRAPRIRSVCSSWAIPSLETTSQYVAAMSLVGFDVRIALDMREEMDLLRGFMVDPADRRVVENEMRRSADPIRRLIMAGLLALGEAAQMGAFTIGRFLALKPQAK
ncbi:MAG: class I SAM-dependent methyltransferase [Burkholderiaceae bacterium]|nr:class I SAM-dependent methyltransferase [Burkholderiaceae bacterium]